MNRTHWLKSIVRDSFAGQVIYCVSGQHWCKPEFEQCSYVIPEKYLSLPTECQSTVNNAFTDQKDDDKVDEHHCETSPTNADLSLNKALIIVDWDGPTDLANPQNWPFPKKLVVAIVMAICFASLYMGAALFTPAEEQLVEQFHTSRVKVTLGLSLFVWGYGVASLWFSPMSELPLFGGRLYIYLFAQLVFACLQIATALTNHVGPFAVLRFLAGVMAAPPVSTGGATYGDMFRFPTVIYALLVWSMGGINGPFMSPLIGAALVQHNSWRWAFWFLFIMSGCVLGLMVFFFPETSEQALLMKKAKSLRRRTGNPNILAPGDIKYRTQKTSDVLKHMFWNPVKLTMREPVLLLMNIHLGLMYSIMYLYFEAIPLSYGGGAYHFNLVQQGLAYLPFLVGCAVAASFFVPYIHFRLVKPTLAGNPPDVFHVFGDSAVVVACIAPVGILIFGWTSHPGIHWIVSMIGNMLFGGSIWLMWQSYMSFISNMYPASQVASAFASNGVARAVLAAAFPLFGRPMYNTLAIEGFPVGWGCALLAFICLPLIGLPVYIRIFGKELHLKALAKYGHH